MSTPSEPLAVPWSRLTSLLLDYAELTKLRVTSLIVMTAWCGLERDTDRRMRRTALRPLPAGRMSMFHGALAGAILTVGGAIYLSLATNALTGVLAS